MKQVAGSHKKPDLPIPPDMASWKVRSTKPHRLHPSADVSSTALAGTKSPAPRPAQQKGKVRCLGLVQKQLRTLTTEFTGMPHVA